jgi:hypothetical protein
VNEIVEAGENRPDSITTAGGGAAGWTSAPVAAPST